MEIIKILTSKGKNENIKVEAIDEDTYRFLEKNEFTYCLTCGYAPDAPDALDELEIVSVSANEGLCETLNEKEHPAKDSDHVALCGNCIEEMLF
jgi:hypothetical protein